MAYLAEGAIGLPVFAVPWAVSRHFWVRPQLILPASCRGFITGWLSERADRSVPRLFVAMGLGHIVIFRGGNCDGSRWHKTGVEKELAVGIAPFVAASVIKNAPAALVPAISILPGSPR